MEQEIKHIVMRSKNYEDLLNFLSSLPYKTSAQIISDVVNEVNANLKVLTVDEINSQAKPEALEPALTVVDSVE